MPNLKLQVREAGRYRVDPEIVRSFPVFPSLSLPLSGQTQAIRTFSVF